MDEKKEKYLYEKRGWLYVGLRTPHPLKPGKIKIRKIGVKLRVGDEVKAERLRQILQSRLDAKREAGEAFDGTLRATRELFVNKRKGKTQTWQDDEQRIRDHVETHVLGDGKMLGKMQMPDIRTRHLVDLFDALKVKVNAGQLAPKTVRNVHGALMALFKFAKKRELIAFNPLLDLERSDLPKNVDKDPEWREGSIFSRKEVKRLIVDQSIPEARRVFYALQTLGCMRFGEVAALQWKKLRFKRKPLGRIRIDVAVKTDGSVGGTKTDRPRDMPMHRALARVLRQWKQVGWAQAMGREPTADDFVCPVVPAAKLNHGRGKRLSPGSHQTQSYYWKRWEMDLVTLGVRHRRGHDLRSTLITYAIEAGAAERVLETCTHTTKAGNAIRAYQKFTWAARCDAVSSFKFVLPKPPQPEAELSEESTLAIAVGADVSPDFPAVPKAEEKPMDTIWRRRESNPLSARAITGGMTPDVPSNVRFLGAPLSFRAPNEAGYGGLSPATGEMGKKEAREALSAIVSDIDKKRRAGESLQQISAARLRRAADVLVGHVEAKLCIRLALEALESAQSSGEQNPSRIVRFLAESALRRIPAEAARS